MLLESTALDVPLVLREYIGITPGADHMFLAHIFPEGDSWGVMIGKNGQDGVCGYGDTISKALIDLANHLG